MKTYRSPWMDKDLDDLADLARTYFEKECAPNEERWCAQQHADREAWTKAGGQGLLCISIPEEYGGGGGTFAHEAVIARQQVRAYAPSLGIGLHNAIITHYFNAYGTAAQKEHWLPKMASGEVVTAIAMTSPGPARTSRASRPRPSRTGTTTSSTARRRSSRTASWPTWCSRCARPIRTPARWASP